MGILLRAGLAARPARLTLVVAVVLVVVLVVELVVVVTIWHFSKGTLAVLVLASGCARELRANRALAGHSCRCESETRLEVFSLLLTTSSASQPQVRLQVEFAAVGKK